MGGLLFSGLITWRQLTDKSQVSALNSGEILQIDCRSLCLSGNYQLYNLEITGARAKLLLSAKKAGQPDLYIIIPADFSEDNAATKSVANPIIWQYWPDTDRGAVPDPAARISFTGMLRSIYALPTEQFESLKQVYPELYLKKGYVLEPLVDQKRATAATTAGTLVVLALCFVASAVWLVNGIHELSGRNMPTPARPGSAEELAGEETFLKLDFITGEQALQQRLHRRPQRDRLTPIVSFLTALVSFLAMRRFVLHLDSGTPLWAEICLGILALGAVVRWIYLPEVDPAQWSGDPTRDRTTAEGTNLIPRQVELQIESIIKLVEQQGFVFRRELLGLPGNYCITKEYLSPDRQTLFHLIWYKNEVRLLFFTKIVSGTTIITLDNTARLNLSDSQSIIKAGVPENFKKTWSIHRRRIAPWSSGLVNFDQTSRASCEFENLMVQEQVLFAKWFALSEMTTEYSRRKKDRQQEPSMTRAGLTRPRHPSQSLVPE